ncbi:MAG: Gldg family protein [Acidobacteriota bacterium]|nr:Gldg family protein [Acidobacteriota bacterium]
MSDLGTETRRRLVASGSLGAGVVLVAALVGFVNYFGWKYHTRLDWTASRFYSLSEKSRNVVRNLDRDIDAIVFMTPASELYPAVSELLSRFDAESTRFTTRMIDPERNPAEAKQLFDRYGITRLNTVVFEAGEDRRVIDEADLAEFDYSGMQYGQGPQIREFAGEQIFAGAILELIEDRKPAILFTVGHGESALDDYGASGYSQMHDRLGTDNFSIDTWQTLGKTEVPVGTDLVVVAGPNVAFLDPELAVLTEYLLGGGRVLLLLEPTLASVGLEGSGFSRWLEDYGVEARESIVVDPATPLPFYSAETFFADDYGAHPITEALDEGAYPVIFSLARPLARGEEADGIEVTELVRSSADSWGETDLENLSAVARTDDDLAGPLGLAFAVEIAPPSGVVDDAVVLLDDAGADTGVGAADATDGDRGGDVGAGASRAGRLVVFGDADFMSNDHLRVGNPTLALNTVNWLVERQNLLAIPARRAEQVQLNLSRSQLASIYWWVLLILPGASVVTGTVVYFRRRR